MKLRVPWGKRQGTEDEQAPERLAAARRLAAVELLETTVHLESEEEAFDVIVNGKVCGYWARTGAGTVSLVWTQGGTAELDPKTAGEADIIEEIRGEIPAIYLPAA